jgi:hypothetical protein
LLLALNLTMEENSDVSNRRKDLAVELLIDDRSVLR